MEDQKSYLSEKNPHPRDSRIRLDVATHAYFVDGVSDYISVSSFKENWFKASFDAKRIASQLENKPEHFRYYGMSADEIQEEWKRKNDEKRQLGTDLHAWIETFYEKRMPPESNNAAYLELYLEELRREGLDLQDLKDANRAWYNFIKFVCANGHWIPFRMEWRIFHEKYKLAGTVDAIFKIPLASGGHKLVLCDWKRVRHLKFTSKHKLGDPKKFKGLGIWPATNYWEYAIQLNLYRIILEDEYNLKIEDMALIRLSEKAKNFEIHLIQREDEPCRAILESRAIHL